MRNYAIVLAAGQGTRFKSSTPKQFIKIGNRYMLEYSIEVFQKHAKIDEIILVCPSTPYISDIKTKFPKISKIVSGGSQRQDSVRLGLDVITDNSGTVLIHDAARPLLTPDIIDKILDKVEDGCTAITAAIPMVDTIAQVDNEIIKSFPKRDQFVRIQTPQAFSIEVLKKAHQMLLDRQDLTVTDDCSLVHFFQLAPIEIVLGSKNNFKITEPSDLTLASKLLI